MITYEGMEYHVLAYLDGIAARMRDIRACESRISEAERFMGLMGVRYTDMPSSPNAYGDGIPDGVIKLMEAREKLSDEVALHQAEIDRAWELCRPQASECRYVLWLNRVQGMPWAKIARAVHVSERKAYQMRVDGICELYGAMPEEYRRQVPKAQA